MSDPMKIAIAGLGTVGVGLVRLLQENSAELTQRCGRPIVVTAVTARDKSKDRGIKLDDQVTWFGPSDRPTTRAIAMHAKRIMNCDLSYPVILTEDGRVFDGMHRVARQLIEGCEFIQVKRFPVNPEPDRTISVSS